MDERRKAAGAHGTILPECQVQFGHLDNRLGELMEAVGQITAALSHQREQTARATAEMRLFWAEVREDIRPAVRSLPAAIAAAVHQHRMEEHPRPDHHRRDSAPSPAPVALDDPAHRIPRWLIYLISGVIAGTMAVLTALREMGAFN